MTSTRNINTKGNYRLETERDQKYLNYETYANSQNGEAYTTTLPALGYNPSHMPRQVFSNNSVDIESALFGINSTNMVIPQEPVVPQLKTIKTVEIFKTPKLIMPKEFNPEKNQRPIFK